MKTSKNKFAVCVPPASERGRSLLFIHALLACCLLSGTAFARNNNSSGPGNKHVQAPSILAGCTPGAAQTDLDVNNVRAHFLTGGDFWWDYSKTSTGQYEVPKGSGLMPLYAGALWIGGYDPGKTLHVAGQEYRNGGNDWWPGPLDTINQAATITADQCLKYDQHYKITQAEVQSFIGGGPMTQTIANWPGNGNTAIGQAQFLAPFFDKDGDGLYKPANGDYPGFDLVSGDNPCQTNGCVPVDHLFGDECLWWVINDAGNIHTESTGKPMGLEVHCQSFGFFTDDEINNMTFINFRIYNRSSLELDSTYIGIWCDPDLGCSSDDFVGCDVARGLGYCYNGTNNDVSCNGENGYGVSPPAVGIDFFRGPIADAGDKVDNNHNCQVDEPCEQIMMQHFMYFINGATYPQADPSVTAAKEWYNYLTGSWEDGSPLTYGGTGYLGTQKANYGFPGKTDHQYEWGTGGNCQNPAPKQADWDEASVPNTPGDRRFVESAGPFKMLPGAVNVVTAGVVWARSSGGNLASVNLMQLADDKAQKLFDNCFQVLNGPDAPDLTIQELDKKLIIYLSNSSSSNNFNERYTEFDPTISLTDSLSNALHCIDTLYHFEGYKIYQLKDNTVSSSDLDNPDKARLLAQFDIKNGVSTIVNYIFNQQLGASVPTTEVTGADQGIIHSLQVKSDLFALGDPGLVNHKSYYYMAVAYGYNNFKPYKQDVVPNYSQNKCSNFVNGQPNASVAAAFDGQKKPYKQGRRNLKSYSAIPHISMPYTGGTEMHAGYGDRPAIDRIEGNGNGGVNLEFTAGTVNEILSASDSRAKVLHYTPGHGPVQVAVADPLNVPDDNSFTLKLDDRERIDYQSAPSAANFKVGDTIIGKTSGAKGIVVFADKSRLRLTKISGKYRIGETFKGANPNVDSAKIVNYMPPPPANQTLDSANWTLTNNTTGETIWSDQCIAIGYEQLALQWGLSLYVQQAAEPGSATAVNNGYITASMTFSDPAKAWLTGLADQEGSVNQNWIRSGTSATAGYADYPGIDDKQVFEGILGGTWAPYRLTSPSSAVPPYTGYYMGAAFKSNVTLANLNKLASVDIVITPDKSKWSRAVVFEMCEDSNMAVNKAYPAVITKPRKHDYRRAPSVDKNGKANYPSADNNDFAYGMGWFPGYAINLETGERLNIAFGENSALNADSAGGKYNQNGGDMIWNPTKNVTADSVPWTSGKTNPVFGGQHYIYIFGHNNDDKPKSLGAPFDSLNVPRYDGCKRIRQILGKNNDSPFDSDRKEIFSDAMWVNIPLLVSGHSLLETDVTVKLRVAKSYKPGYSPANYKKGTTIVYTDTVNPGAAQNRNLPMYTFTTDGIATHTEQHDLAVEALDLINVVPNPYYAYAAYETNAIDTRVKITNLPEQCTISIYNLGGTLIKRIKKGDAVVALKPKGSSDPTAWHDGSLDWDLKNTAGTPISSGVYIIHVEVPGVGEKVIKWFGVMRPADVGQF